MGLHSYFLVFFTPIGQRYDTLRLTTMTYHYGSPRQRYDALRGSWHVIGGNDLACSVGAEDAPRKRQREDESVAALSDGSLDWRHRRWPDSAQLAGAGAAVAVRSGRRAAWRARLSKSSAEALRARRLCFLFFKTVLDTPLKIIEGWFKIVTSTRLTLPRLPC